VRKGGDLGRPSHGHRFQDGLNQLLKVSAEGVQGEPGWTSDLGAEVR